MGGRRLRAVLAVGTTIALSAALTDAGVALGHAAAPSVTSAPVQIAQTRDGAVGYRSVGRGPALVLIMGFTGTMDAWPPAFVDGLALTHRVIVFDNAGIGRTTMPAGTLTIDSMADQTDALISALHLGRVDVLGWSMGGMVAQALAVLHPWDVGRLVLGATVPGNGNVTQPAAAVVEALAAAPGGGATAMLSLLFPAGDTTDLDAYVQSITAYPGFYLAPTSVMEAQLSAIETWTLGTDPAGRRIGRIASQTLVADGTDDAIVPVANDYALTRAIPRSRLVLYPGAGHGFMFQDRVAWTEAVDEFLGWPPPVGAGSGR